MQNTKDDINGQISLFDKKTNLDMLKSVVNADQFVRLYTEKLGCLCLQSVAKSNQKEVFKAICLKDYRGYEGCEKCKRRFLNMEYRENFTLDMIDEFLNGAD